MNKDLLQQYANLKEQEKVIAEEIAKINPLILAEILAAEVDKVEAKGIGTFSLAQRKTWKYSETVVVAEKSLDDLKATEKKDGTATATEKPYLIFKGPKE